MEAQTLDSFLPRLLTQDTKTRIEVGEDLVAYLRNDEASLYCDDMNVLVNGLIELLSDSNIKVSLTGHEALSCLIDRMAGHFKPHITRILPAAVDRLGDSNDQVRESAKVLLLKLIKPASSPQYIFDRLSIAFTHKMWKVREETLLFLQKALNDFGAKSLGLVVPTVAKLLDDKSIPVQEQAVNSLVEVYRHTGERVRSNLAELEIDQTRLNQIYTKMDEVKNSGGMLATGTHLIKVEKKDSVEEKLPFEESRPVLPSAAMSEETERTCRCGLLTKYSNANFYCKTTCKKLRSCGKHICNLRCCAECKPCKSNDHGVIRMPTIELRTLCSRLKVMSSYSIMVEGPPFAKLYTAKVEVLGYSSEGKGSSKNKARQEAASGLLQQLAETGLYTDLGDQAHLPNRKYSFIRDGVNITDILESDNIIRVVVINNRGPPSPKIPWI